MSTVSIKNDYVTLAVKDANEMSAYISMPEKIETSLPALIIFQEAFGVTGHIRNVADSFAKQGYVTIAPELFHRTAPKGFEGNYADFASIAPHFHAITDAGLEADLLAAWDWLKKQSYVKQDAISSIGYCMGGRVSFLANTILPLRSAVSYYGGRVVPDLIKQAPKLHGPMLFFWGGLDKHILNEHIQTITSELDKENKSYVNVKFSYADHAFNCDARANYNKRAATEALAMTLAFLKTE
ncbi:MAG: dienelactone hydrolase family protein [Bacteroidia bacterium]